MMTVITTLEALAFNTAAGEAPDWVQLTPAGRQVLGRDGRRWRVSDPGAVVAAFNAYGKRAQIDIEHSTQIKGPKGEFAPAVGWIEELEARHDGSLWGRAEWTAEGLNIVGGRAYRYLSPVFHFDRRTGEVLRIVSAGLTNNPNLQLAALNAADPDNEEQHGMDTAVLDALGLAHSATAAEAVVAINRLCEARDTALNAARQPDASQFVPMADHQLALNRITEFEAAETARQDEAVGAAVDAAIAAGRIAPASRDYHIAACRAEGGLERFAAAMAVTPAITTPSGLDAKKPGEGGAALTAEELAVCQMFDTQAADFAAAKKDA